MRGMVAHASRHVQPASQQLFSIFLLMILDSVTYDMLTFEPSPDSFLSHTKWSFVISIVPDSRLSFFTKSVLQIAVILFFAAILYSPATAQTDGFGDNAADP